MKGFVLGCREPLRELWGGILEWWLVKLVANLIIKPFCDPNLIYRNFRFCILRYYYKKALRRAAGGMERPELAKAAIQILRGKFFDEYVKPFNVSHEFAEFLRRLQEQLPGVSEDEVKSFLEGAYRELAIALEGNEQWENRSNRIADFLRQRTERKEAEALEEGRLIVPDISYFIIPPQPANFLDREPQLEQLEEWLADQQQTVGVLVGMGGQGKTYLAARFAEKQQPGWQVRWAEFPLTVEQLLLSLATEMQRGATPSLPSSATRNGHEVCAGITLCGF